MHLSVHLENGQRVYFTPDNFGDRIKNPPNTTLLAFFDLCKVDYFAQTLLYSEIPAYYVWKQNNFSRRKQGINVPNQPGLKKDNVLGRVYTVHPMNTECYYLRILLHEVRGPTCFRDLKNVNGVIHPTFQSACRALGLLEGDNHWNNTLEEAAASKYPKKIRELFSVMLVFCQIADALTLWENYKDIMSEYVKMNFHKECQDTVVTDMAFIHNKTLILLEDLVFYMSGHYLQQYGLPTPSHTKLNDTFNRDLQSEISYDELELSRLVKENESKLNIEQQKV